MKANAPEKIYCVATDGGFYLTTIKPEPPFAEGVEYYCTDAFIEKASRLFEEKLKELGFLKIEREPIIENFKKAMAI